MLKTLYFKFSLVTILSILVIMAVQIIAGYRFRLHSYNQELIHTTEQTIGRLEKNIGDFIEVYAVFDYENAIAREMVNADFAAIIIDDQNIAHSFGKQHYIKGKIRNNKDSVIDYDPSRPQHRNILQECAYQSERIIKKNGKVIGKIEIYSTNQRLAKTLEDFVKASVIQTFIVCISLSFILLFSIRKLLTNPIRKLAEAARSIESGDYKTRAKVGSKDEVGELATTFNSMTDQLKQTLENFQKEIEERKQAENALRESESLLTLSQQIAHVGSWKLDLTTNHLAWSDEVYHIFGLNPQKFTATFEAFLDTVHPDDRATVDDAYSESLLDGKDSYEIEHRIVRQDTGEICHLHERCVHERDASGRIICSTGMVQDITERKQAEEQVRFLSLITEYTTDAILVTDTDFIITYLNKSFEKLFGYSLEDLKGKTPDSLNVEPMSIQIQQELYETVASGKEYIGESQNRRKDGSTFICEYKTMPLKNQSGQIYAYVGVQRDITERKQAELSLRESEEKFRNFAEQSFVGFYILQDGSFKYVNPKFADIFGYTVEEVQDNKQIRQLVHSEDQATVMEQIRRRIEGEINAVQYRFRGIKKTGEIIHLEVYGGSSLIYDNKPATIGTILDITTNLEMEKRLAQSQRIESIGSLAGGIAHDFNNILFPIVGMSELLLEDLPRQSQQYENAEEIFKAGKRGSDLVKQILTFSRQAEHKLIPVRVQQVLKEVLKLTRATIPSNIEINQNVQPDCGLVMADPTQIHQISMNLITNASHALEKKNGVIDIELKELTIKKYDLPDSELQPGPHIKLSVSDNGIGMVQSTINKIFEPYFTTKEKGKGTGLGLAVVYGIVKEHKGDIKVYSEIGKGTTFCIYLPLMKKSTEAVSTEQTLELATGTERILLVDDEVSVAQLESQMLSRLGYHVIAETSSKDALNAFRSNPESFDLVISDMTMPDMTGDQLAKKILSIRPETPIVICTGFSERINKEQAEVLGVKGFLMKPVVKSDMAQMIRKVLDESKVS